MSVDVTLEDIAAGLRPFGLVPRGGFVFDRQTLPPNLASEARPVSVVMIGHFGSAIWPHFIKWQQLQSGVTDPLDAWSKHVLNRVAMKFGAVAVFPSDRPYQPFQQWAKRAEGISASPLGLLIHPQYGLWQAFRGALLFDCEIEFSQQSTASHPCDTCLEKPCLSACPVNAFNGTDFAVDCCRDYLSSEGFECMENGCKARLACPVGQEHTYLQDQQRFHMAAFA
ncbi:hypothetical protein [Phyllobacterium sp. SB3]|uniref:hypothetical protein n=1 Tax=Phyllobacterium sp. SB3 TaxID=3156073 RepID=UPI0032AEFCEA